MAREKDVDVEVILVQKFKLLHKFALISLDKKERKNISIENNEVSSFTSILRGVDKAQFKKERVSFDIELENEVILLVFRFKYLSTYQKDSHLDFSSFILA